MKNAERVTGTKNVFRGKNILTEKETAGGIATDGTQYLSGRRMWKQACIDTGCGDPVFLYRILAL